ncbi:FAD-dependent oxidoreductase [Rubellimicrobium sp. CFH 75288]|uniref:FAD-dependent oxidoreductase n=1 Tax=Rubellimicrobium sp. CFH 75288 TaxID=2697034 RepID=UPI0014134066|nr:FAD-dependent oxidoreductase [Rubellimicrobium sp. CFH 75288]NAZ35487.1 FAD-dependent oxidoreductase [Rubellimicrobium sp. CFH 75288]
MAFDVDLFVIGGGSGGVRAARMAAARGARVALAEQSRLGGTCVIRGCVPKKIMVFASQFRETLDLAPGYGWTLGDGAFSWETFRARLDAELDRLEGVYRRLLEGSGVTIHPTRAVLEDPHTVRLEDGGRVSAAHVLVATGGHPVRPDIPGAALGLVSDDMFTLDRLPRSLLIVGGGYIACEMAGIFAGLGVQVTQFYRGAQILRGFDDEARGLVAEALQERGVSLHVGTDLLCLGGPDAVFDLPAGERPPEPEGPSDGPVKVKPTHGAEQVFDAVLFATGRAPSTKGLGLEEIGVRLGRRGHVEVDRYSQTAVPSVYAIGDATDRPALTPVAIRDAMAFAETVFGGKPTPVDHEALASAVFTQPELGTVGLTEEEAREREPVEIYATSFRPLRTAFAERPDRVLMKLVVSRETRRVLGVHIVAPDAGEMIQLAAIAVRMGATKEDFDRTIAVHPTMAEEMVTLREPVRRA